MAYVNYLIAGRVAQDAKVVLSGMGGDEIHGGYVGRYALVPRPAVTDLSTDANGHSSLSRLARWWRTAMRPAKRAEAVDPLEVYRCMLSFPLPESQRQQALTPEFLAEAGDFPVREVIDAQIARAPSRDPWDVVMYVDARTYLHGLLVLEDKLSMAHSLETRVPLLDNALVDYVGTLPWALLCDGTEGKRVFRHSVRPWVSEAVFSKPKMGFGPPDASWYRGALRPWIESTFTPARVRARGIFRPEFTSRVLAEHFDGHVNHLPLIWSMLSLESWCRQFGVLGGELEVVT
jgi:asparagine synthase (glutamine-hydrolysing)